MTGTPDWQPVTSSTIAALAYDPATETLAVRFRTGAEYAYSAVPEDVYRLLLQSPSVGSAFHAFVKQAGYSYERIG